MWIMAGGAHPMESVLNSSVPVIRTMAGMVRLRGGACVQLASESSAASERIQVEVIAGGGKRVEFLGGTKNGDEVDGA